jgi:hypothetical protein
MTKKSDRKRKALRENEGRKERDGYREGTKVTRRQEKKSEKDCFIFRKDLCVGKG